ncbi:peptidase S41 [Aliidiomarina taiwanensis]|uniref:Tricorn protease homolog n=1 Tax=Aliidiomarina taiwanensis TaxID=946228 RepID=A0A432WVT2_9GAMM|nr:S41 family peptidase [Aliidiomarina taiwanensis]RUO37876.1 peptidase S41 [Aliidiomarina taiwanensis]
MKRKASLSLVLTGLVLSGIATAPASFATETALSSTNGYYRAPHLVNDQLVFTAEGDIWLTQLNSNTPRRLTSSEAEENHAKLSPNGDMVAFVANYEGASEVYVMPTQGGTPKRVSFEQSRVRLQSWTPDGHLLYATDHVMGPANQWVLRKVNPSTLHTETIPLIDAIEGVTDTHGKQLFFTRFGLQATTDNARVYRGGAMGQIWRYQLGSDQEAVHLTAGHEGSVRKPMYWQGRVYFISDADGTPNIWSVSEQGGDFTQHTHFDTWQVWDATLSNGTIVYQQGADLHVFDLNNNQASPLTLSLASDFRQRQERWLTKPLDYLTHMSFGGSDEQVVLTARSQVALAAKAPRRLVQIDTPEASRSRHAIISHDGKWVYAINDHTGENEIWRFAADGSSDAKQLTHDGNTFRWNLYLSPNGRYLAHDDKDGNLWLLDLEKNKNERIFTGANGHTPLGKLAWSHDSTALAFSRTDLQGSRHQVLLYSLKDNRTEVVTSNKYASYSPAFSRDGNWLYFLSDRHFKATPTSPWGDRNMGPVFNKRTQIYALALKRQACFPFAPPAEVVHCDNEAAEKERTARLRSKPIDWDGLTDRLWQVPVAADNYYNLEVTDTRLYVQARDNGPASLYQIPFAQTDISREVFASHVNSYQVSRDGKRLFFRQGKPHELYIVDTGAKAPSDLSKARIATNQWQLAINPQVEWQQMFHDAWIMHRDFLFDRNMRGVDWDAMRAQYQPLVARLTDRRELDDLFAQLLSELNVLHSQVRGGEYAQRADRPAAASLAAAFSNHRDGLQIAHIYQTDPELPMAAAPFAKPGVKAQVGDVITHINGAPVKHLGDLTTALRGQVGKQVRVDLKRGRETWSTIVEPVTPNADHRLRYQDWVQKNRSKVAEASDGKFGYIHIYAMGGNDIAAFAREFYDNVDKDGLVIDVRRNRGGNIDSWIIEKLLRRAWMFWQPRQGEGYTNMQQTFRGQLVVLTDQLTYSDGETFSAGVKTLGLGPLIGKRTTGAGVWLSGRNRLADRGVARVAETPQHAMDGTWVVEGYGVEPDIEVENLPYVTFNGSDAQLERGIEVLRELLEKNPRPTLTPGSLDAPYGADPVNRD